jgi:hypothetical protein
MSGGEERAPSGISDKREAESLRGKGRSLARRSQKNGKRGRQRVREVTGGKKNRREKVEIFNEVRERKFGFFVIFHVAFPI